MEAQFHSVSAITTDSIVCVCALSSTHASQHFSDSQTLIKWSYREKKSKTQRTKQRLLSRFLSAHFLSFPLSVEVLCFREGSSNSQNSREDDSSHLDRELKKVAFQHR